jgi:hypothetical protein
MRRALAFLSAAVLLVAALEACNSDERAPFEPPTPAAESPEAGPGFYEAGSAVPQSCDADALALKSSLAGCRFLTTDSTYTAGMLSGWFPKGCHPLIVTNPMKTAAHLRLRFRGREEDAAPYAALPQVSGRDVSYVALHDGILGPDESAIVSIIFAPFESGEIDRSSRCPTKAFVEGLALLSQIGRLLGYATA